MHEHDAPNKKTMVQVHHFVCEAGLRWGHVASRFEYKVNDLMAEGWTELRRDRHGFLRVEHSMLLGRYVCWHCLCRQCECNEKG